MPRERRGQSSNSVASIEVEFPFLTVASIEVEFICHVEVEFEGKYCMISLCRLPFHNTYRQMAKMPDHVNLFDVIREAKSTV